MSDIAIAREATMKPISEVAEKLHIPESAIIAYGKTKAKIDPEYLSSSERPARWQTYSGHGDHSNAGW